MKLKNKKNGFLLVEVVIYLALFSVMLSGAITGFYYLINSNQDLEGHVALINETEFIFKKIDWILSGVSQIYLADKNLVVINHRNETIVFGLDDAKVFVRYGEDGEKHFLNNDNFAIENLVFEIDSSLPNRFLIKISFDANGEKFSASRFGYIERK